MVVSLVARDAPARGLDRAAPLATFAQALAQAGLVVSRHAPASDDEVRRLGSSWAKRLGVPNRRPAWLLEARRLARFIHELAR